MLKTVVSSKVQDNFSSPSQFVFPYITGWVNEIIKEKVIQS